MLWQEILEILQEIAVAVRPKLPSSIRLTVDIGNGYRFPLHIAPTDLRFGMVGWQMQVIVLGWTDSLFWNQFWRSSTEENSQVYWPSRASETEWICHYTYHTPRQPSLLYSSSHLATVVDMTPRELSHLLQRVARAAIVGSHHLVLTKLNSIESWNVLFLGLFYTLNMFCLFVFVVPSNCVVTFV